MHNNSPFYIKIGHYDPWFGIIKTIEDNCPHNIDNKSHMTDSLLREVVKNCYGQLK